ncbi:MAG: ACP phosphodiesterase [Gallionella sp.]
MNYLAHLFLSPNNDLVKIGNLAGDFTKGVDQTLLPEEMQHGIVLHQAIDKFTDSHPIVAQSKKRIRPTYRRFSGVLIDVFYDHFLASHWQTSSDIPLACFSQNIYTLLATHQTILPPRLQQTVPIMRAEDWLTSYQTTSGIEQSLKRIQTRLKYDFALAPAIDELTCQYDDFKQDFTLFFPDIVAHVRVREEARLIQR